jgi:transcription termination factor Rho
LSEEETLNPAPVPSDDGSSEAADAVARAPRGRRRQPAGDGQGERSSEEPRTATAVVEGQDLTDTSADRGDQRPDREFSRRHRNGGRGDRGGRRDRQDRPERGNRGDSFPRGERAEYGPRELRSHEIDPADLPQNGHSGDVPRFTVTELDQMEPEGLIELARTFDIQGFSRMKRPDLISRLLRARTEMEGNIFGDGVLEIVDEGYGFLRGQRLLPGHDDIYVSQSQIRRFGLRTGDRISGQVRPPKDNEKFFSLLRVEAVNGVDPEVARRRPSFDTLTPIFPLEMINLETTANILSTRLLNLVAPVGKGQRGLIVSPPKAGKTLLLKAIANGITANDPDMHLMVCLIGERPEEVTDMKRSVEGEVISSTFDEPVEDHTKGAEMALERAKRLVEAGRDVTILLDSITRLARAYNLAVPPSGRTLSGGIDPVALYPPKRFFGAARNIEGGGSLTIVATCLVDTGSRMDDVIYEEFKGTGNMELHLDRKLAERRIYPSIDVQRSGTRREELLMDDATLRQVWTMRRMVSMLGGSEGTELLLGRLSKTGSNAEFLATLNKDV